MQNRHAIETWVGVFAVAGMAALFMLAMKVSNIATLTGDSGYTVTARFDNIGGLKVRSQVSMAGVRVGRVVDIGFDDQTYEAVVTMRIDQKYDRLPKDTSARILTSGVLGENYIGLEAGARNSFLENGDEIKITQSALVLENLIGQFLVNQAQQNRGSSN
ncbi:MAG: outer membrane lipid asymmetry maintenance protein MlaD [Gammaproteobacteria bacterium]|jgi:phospholipid/cholesterol/gamma-HCH transport system substrate-binding protein